MNRLESKLVQRTRRKKRVRRKITGTESRPRMTVFKSNKHVYVQVIDDRAGNTISSASTVEKDNRGSLKRTVEDAEKLGEIMGKRLQEKDIKTIVFDRNGYRYHGIVKAVAEGVRKAGLQF
jgi:large subunit ribosomal protein L18